MLGWWVGGWNSSNIVFWWYMTSWGRWRPRFLFPVFLNVFGFAFFVARTPPQSSLNGSASSPWSPWVAFLWFWHRFWSHFGSHFLLKIWSKVYAQIEATKPRTNNKITYKKHALRPCFFGSRSCSEICRANAFYSVNHMVCVHAAFSEKQFCSVHPMLVWV